MREFEMQKMEEIEAVKDYTDRMLILANNIKMLREEFSDIRVVEKILVTLPERFESKISSLEESKDLSIITLAELINVLQAQEQRRAYRKDETIERAFQVKEADQAQGGNKEKKQWSKKNSKKGESNNNGGSKGNHPLCPYCKKTSYLKKKCWFKPKFSAGHANNWGIWRGCVKTNNKKNTKLKQWINTRRSNFLLHLVFLVAVQVMIGL
ncbi:hypothetical protein VitviT2T_021221 [Vitis vinifera]|uniref:Retrovirus-related Pol polyprotein from transposon TNT 1-94 n=1 Tax=Vitis vinifera TaxID=29760 RepID=A0ABY9D7W5_VITVI|nr:hypothetical protein VitviT2T_021221 [Vitis vinifera]